MSYMLEKMPQQYRPPENRTPFRKNEDMIRDAQDLAKEEAARAGEDGSDTSETMLDQKVKWRKDKNMRSDHEKYDSTTTH